MPLKQKSTRRLAAVLALTALVSGCDGGPSANSVAEAASAVTKAAKGVEVTLKSVVASHDIGPAGMVPSAAAGVTYVVATYGLKNVGPEAIPLDKWPQPRLVDPAGHELQPEVMNSTMLSAAANPSWAENLNPGLSTDATLVWKVDEKTFDRKTWKLLFKANPPLTFALQ